MNIFNSQFFNQEYVNPTYYRQTCVNHHFQEQVQRDYEEKQMKEIANAAKAMRDLCRAVKKIDSRYQQQAFIECLTVCAEEWGWNQQNPR